MRNVIRDKSGRLIGTTQVDSSDNIIVRDASGRLLGGLHGYSRGSQTPYTDEWTKWRSTVLDNLRQSANHGNDVSRRTLESILDAEAQGLAVEMQFSSFNDPGPDWSHILVDGVVVPLRTGRKCHAFAGLRYDHHRIRPAAPVSWSRTCAPATLWQSSCGSSGRPPMRPCSHLGRRPTGRTSGSRPT